MEFNSAFKGLMSVGSKPNRSIAPPASLNAALMTRIFLNQKIETAQGLCGGSNYLYNGQRDYVGYGKRMW
jgi:hypothetical protein